jgi:hypothetical protein
MPTKEKHRLDATPVFENGVDAWVDDALRRPDSFILWHDDPKMFTTWSMGPVIETRDSDTITRSNAKALIEYLESDPSLSGWEVKGCSHWAVGHVDHLSFQVLEKIGKALPKSTAYIVTSRPGFKLTRIARVVKKWFDDLAEYPVADEESLGELELEEGIAEVENCVSSALRGTGFELKDKLPEGWVCDVHRILDRDGNVYAGGGGMCVNEEALFEALKTLDCVQPET